MKLSRVTIERFKRVETVDLPLSNLNILVGANSSGKSSIIQAVHLASCLIRQASEVREAKTSTVGIHDLDYLPTDEYQELGNNANWGNRKGSQSSKVSFTFVSDQDQNLTSAFAEFRSARNAGISITGSIPQDLLVVLRPKAKFFSAYIPGISGIPNREQKNSKRVVLKACSYGDSNVYLRNALDLLKENSENIPKLEGWLSNIIGDIRIVVNYQNERDLFIACRIEQNGVERPIELIGMGYLQLIQIFCYILLFKPRILLIDEPDIHLHPNVQEKMCQILASVASEMDLKILLTTHSPFIVRGAPVDANVYWVKDGVIENTNRREVELALGWGAFGKKILIVSEDTDTSLLKKIISFWPEIDNFVTFYPGTGFKNLTTPKQAKEIYDALGGKFKILVHRDRDSLTDDEVARLQQDYEAEGVHLWLPELSDIEAYFCGNQFLQEFLECTEDDVAAIIEGILAGRAQEIRAQFDRQRASHNEELHKTGGSPTNEDVWNSFQGRPLRGAKGKYIFNQLKNAAPGNKFREEAVLNHQLNRELAPTLKTKLEGLLAD